ncbi:MAG TPA: deoxyribose-phosphate aldolase [Phycisphaerales bacterium]|nr:deoxyribose-phosphate aldolase [Phycisphaerales bacterium]HMP37218.1 deoxyribose-phosphate aldolase [Phycisphaerales bacterium]
MDSPAARAIASPVPRGAPRAAGASARARRPVDAVMAEARAASFTKRSIKGEMKKSGLLRAISMLDLTTLEGRDSEEKVRALCRKAAQPDPTLALPDGRPIPSVAAVCVYPTLVAVARAALAGSSVRVASVASGFPSGQYPLDVRLRDVEEAVAAGADEIDMVISRGAFLAGRLEAVAEEIRAVRRACGPAHLKIILETGELETLDNVRRASDLAIEAASSVPGLPPPGDGDVFIKTSTGKVQPAATMPVTLVMLEAIRDHFSASGVRIGMKPAGGIRTAKSALHYMVMVKETLGDEWLSPHLFRFGASTLLNDLLRQIRWAWTGRYAAASDLSEG